MADLSKIISIVQGKTQNTNEGYKNAIIATIESAWAEMGDRHPWWFLRSPAYYNFTTIAGTSVYKLDKEEIGKILFVGNAGGGKQINIYDDSELSEVVGAVDSADLTNSGSPGFPARAVPCGLMNDRKAIELKPVPDGAYTFYVKYNIKPSLAQITRLPESHIICLIHRVMSVLAPPIEKNSVNGISWWKAITKDEYFLYEASLSTLIIEARQYHVDGLGPKFDSDTMTALSDISN